MNKRILFYTLILFLSIGLGVAFSQTTLTPKELLGKHIFFDEKLSLNSNQSCAACHGQQAGWTGPDSNINSYGAVYEGSIPGAFGDRKPPRALCCLPEAYEMHHPLVLVHYIFSETIIIR